MPSPSPLLINWPALTWACPDNWALPAVVSWVLLGLFHRLILFSWGQKMTSKENRRT